VIGIWRCAGNAQPQTLILLSDGPAWGEKGRMFMTKLKLFYSAAILSALAATPALAQHMIEEPGMFAFVHPDGDLGIASRQPPADSMATVSGDRSMVPMHMEIRPGLRRVDRLQSR
jgi:hypothetical protein